MIKEVRDYIKQCPLVQNGKINVNYLSETPIKYTIDNVPANPIVKKYCDGGSLRQFLFVFASREAYDENTLENMQISQFFEDFANWIETQNDNKNYPTILDNKIIPTKIEVLTSGYMYSTTPNTARFQIQLKLTYRKEV